MTRQPESNQPARNPGPGAGPQPVATPLAASSADDAPPQNNAPHDLQHHPPHHIPRWLERGELFLRVLLRLYVGLALCCAPWWPLAWDRNPLFAHFPTLAIYASNGAVRGLVSGLGLLNLWIAFRDVLHRHDD